MTNSEQPVKNVTTEKLSYTMLEHVEVLRHPLNIREMQKSYLKPYPTIKGIQLILDQLSQNNPKAKTAKPEEFIDTTVLKEIDQSGFIDQLYK